MWIRGWGGLSAVLWLGAEQSVNCSAFKKISFRDPRTSALFSLSTRLATATFLKHNILTIAPDEYRVHDVRWCLFKLKGCGGSVRYPGDHSGSGEANICACAPNPSRAASIGFDTCQSSGGRSTLTSDNASVAANSNLDRRHERQRLWFLWDRSNVSSLWWLPLAVTARLTAQRIPWPHL